MDKSTHKKRYIVTRDKRMHAFYTDTKGDNSSVQDRNGCCIDFDTLKRMNCKDDNDENKENNNIPKIVIPKNNTFIVPLFGYNQVSTLAPTALPNFSLGFGSNPLGFGVDKSAMDSNNKSLLDFTGQIASFTCPLESADISVLDLYIQVTTLGDKTLVPIHVKKITANIFTVPKSQKEISDEPDKIKSETMELSTTQAFSIKQISTTKYVTLTTPSDNNHPLQVVRGEKIFVNIQLEFYDGNEQEEDEGKEENEIGDGGGGGSSNNNNNRITTSNNNDDNRDKILGLKTNSEMNKLKRDKIHHKQVPRNSLNNNNSNDVTNSQKQSQRGIRRHRKPTAGCGEPDCDSNGAAPKVDASCMVVVTGSMKMRDTSDDSPAIEPI
jgi:hypothetical protein